MKLIVCLDDRCGMAWGGRRQSRDRLVTEDIVRHVGNAPLYVTPYSAPLFEGYSLDLHTSETPLSNAPEAAFCFLERIAPKSCDTIEELIVYRWNRHYPSDVTFDPTAFGFLKVASTEFAGFSHEKITKEVLKK